MDICFDRVITMATAFNTWQGGQMEKGVRKSCILGWTDGHVGHC